MKNKVTIMDKHQRIADEEIDRFKNFDALLSKYQATPTNKIGFNRVKWIVSILIISGATFSVFYLTNDRALEISKHEGDVVNSTPELKKSSDTVNEIETSSNGNKLVQKQKNESPPTKTEKPESKKEIAVSEFIPVYVQAEPIEGYAHLYDYFNKELIYPAVAINDSIQGVLTVSFTINKDGLPENLQFTNSLGQAFEEEAERLILSMPLWKPATLNNKPVPSRLSLPLTFQVKSIKKQTN